jgi:argininosuccinate lyase
LQGLEVHELSDSELLEIDPGLSANLRNFLTAEAAIDSRNSISGTSTKSVQAQLGQLEEKIRGYSSWITGERKRFSGMMSA